MKTNKNSATDDELGVLHKIVTKGYTYLVKGQVDAYEVAEEKGDRDEMSFIIDSRDLASAAKWVKDQEMGSLPAYEEEGNPVNDELEELKNRHRNNVIKFVEDDAANLVVNG